MRAASRLNATLELKTILTVVCEEICAALHVPLAVYFLYDSKNRGFRLTADSGLPAGLAESMEPLPWSACDELVKKLGKFGVVPNLASTPDLPYAELFLEHGIKSYAYAVLERDNLPMGLLLTVSTDEESILTEDAPELLAGLAHQASSAIANAELFTEAQEHLRQLKSLRNIDMAITNSLDLEITFQVILDEVTNMLSIDAAAILSLNPHTGTLKYDFWRGFRTKDLKNINLSLNKGYGGRAAAERQMIHIPNLHEVEPDPVQGSLLTEEGFYAYCAIPLIAKGSVRGVLEIFHREPIDSNIDWLTFLETLAGQAAVAIDYVELFHKLERSNLDLLRAYNATIEGWAYALDLKDEETEGHSKRVTEMTVDIARVMGVNDEELAHVRRGALLHDIGKMGIPDAILLKPGKLNDEEREIMKKHPIYAYNMLAPIDYLRSALDIPYCHHEKWDGTGYPRGIKGEAIPLPARIFAVVDVYDALTSDRPYRKAWSEDKALKLIKEESGKHFDPQVVELFLKEIEDRT
jgi:putative nucleotidyltransferase with HDIG domain